MTRVLSFCRPISFLGVCAALLACSAREPAAIARTPAPSRDPASAVPITPDVTIPDTVGWLAVDSAVRSVALELLVTAPPGAPSALINGYRSGEATLIVPLGWTIQWDWRSADSTAPHSLVVMVQREKIPLEGGRASFSNAMTRSVTEGLRPEQADQSTFLAEEAGWYWMLCGVPSHALNGEWLELRVDPDATTASVKVKER
jgi:hypothetical protein